MFQRNDKPTNKKAKEKFCQDITSQPQIPDVYSNVIQANFNPKEVGSISNNFPGGTIGYEVGLSLGLENVNFGLFIIPSPTQKTTEPIRFTPDENKGIYLIPN